jgi:hypothetical protein
MSKTVRSGPSLEVLEGGKGLPIYDSGLVLKEVGLGATATQLPPLSGSEARQSAGPNLRLIKSDQSASHQSR